jgi:glycosyltransferase involved in cell wall biosynthesis
MQNDLSGQNKKEIGGSLDRIMRIAYVTETWPPEINGVSRTAARTVAHLRSKGHDVEVIRPLQTGTPDDHALDTATEKLVLGVPIPMYRDVRFGVPSIGQLRRYWSIQRPDLVHVATEGLLGYTAVRNAVAMGIPVTSDFRTRFDVYTRHYAPAALTKIVNAYLRRLHNRCARTFAPTEEMRRSLEAEGFARVAVSGRGVDCEALAPSRRSAAQREAWKASGPVALYVGRFAREKNLPLVVKAFHAMQATCAETRMVFVGDGPLLEELRRSCPNAIFAGMQQGEALARHYASADIFLFPSLSETFGNVTLEAMASGLATLAYRSAAAAVHIKSGVNGITVDPADEAAFCQAAVQLAENQLMRRRLSVAARQSALSVSWRSILDDFESQLVSFATPGQHNEHALVA